VIPEGLHRCGQCGELRGRFLYAGTVDAEPRATEVHCLCAGIVCRSCKERAIHRPISDYYDEATGTVWHVPWFGYRLPCQVCRSRTSPPGVRLGLSMADSSVMSHAGDLEDTQLLEAGNLAALLAKYDATILGRCIARLRGSLDAEDVAQNVRLRVVAEFRRGRRYGGTPYRVVVHQVIGWTLADYFAGRPTDVPLPESWQPAVEGDQEALMSHYYLEWLFEQLPEGTRRVLELRYLQGLEPTQIAEQLGIRRNAVDQALHRGHGKLREALVGG